MEITETQELLQFLRNVNNHLVQIKEHIERENLPNKDELLRYVDNTRSNLVELADHANKGNFDANSFRTFKASLFELIDKRIFTFNNEQEKQGLIGKMNELEEKILEANDGTSKSMKEYVRSMRAEEEMKSVQDFIDRLPKNSFLRVRKPNHNKSDRTDAEIVIDGWIMDGGSYHKNYFKHFDVRVNKNTPYNALKKTIDNWNGSVFIYDKKFMEEKYEEVLRGRINISHVELFDRNSVNLQQLFKDPDKIYVISFEHNELLFTYNCYYSQQKCLFYSGHPSRLKGDVGADSEPLHIPEVELEKEFNPLLFKKLVDNDAIIESQAFNYERLKLKDEHGQLRSYGLIYQFS